MDLPVRNHIRLNFSIFLYGFPSCLSVVVIIPNIFLKPRFNLEPYPHVPKLNDTLCGKDNRINIELALPPNTPFNRGGVLKQ